MATMLQFQQKQQLFKQQLMGWRSRLYEHDKQWQDRTHRYRRIPHHKSDYEKKRAYLNAQVQQAQAQLDRLLSQQDRLSKLMHQNDPAPEPSLFQERMPTSGNNLQYTSTVPTVLFPQQVDAATNRGTAGSMYNYQQPQPNQLYNQYKPSTQRQLPPTGMPFRGQTKGASFNQPNQQETHQNWLSVNLPSQQPPSSYLGPSGGPSEIKYLALSDVVIQSTLKDNDSRIQANKIVEAFNSHLGFNDSIMVPSNFFGSVVPVDEFRLVHRNRIPELVSHSGIPVRKIISFGDSIADIGYFKQTTPFFGAHGVYVINVPQGQYGLAWSGTQPLLYGEGPHVVHDNNFRFEKLHPAFCPYLRHGTIHILRIPKGFIVKAWHSSEAVFLEAQDEPYVLNTTLFAVEYKDQIRELFYSAADSIIVHGSLKRIIPRTGDVAITYDNGHLCVLSSKDCEKPILITSPTHTFDSFLSTAIQTLIFPSETTKFTRRRDNPQDKNFMFEVFRTSDGLPIGVKVLVVFQISQPQLTLTKLSKDQIIPHIENIVVADLGTAIQSHSVYDFQNSGPSIPSTKDFFRNFQLQVAEKLALDLLEFGIRLIRINVETPQVLDYDLARKVSQFALVTKQAEAQASVLGKQLLITQSRAASQAEQERIEQERTNQNVVNAAKADALAKQLEVAAALQTTKFEAEATRIKASAEAEAAMVHTIAKEKEALLLSQFPVYSHLCQAEVFAKALHKIPTIIVPDNSIFVGTALPRGPYQEAAITTTNSEEWRTEEDAAQFTQIERVVESLLCMNLDRICIPEDTPDQFPTFDPLTLVPNSF
ncbi:vacuolin A [Pelomyxa schiedti]|nr:vacuolin A [Pelomyxa schiedti]